MKVILLLLLFGVPAEMFIPGIIKKLLTPPMKESDKLIIDHIVSLMKSPINEIVWRMTLQQRNVTIDMLNEWYSYFSSHDIVDTIHEGILGYPRTRSKILDLLDTLNGTRRTDVEKFGNKTILATRILQPIFPLITTEMIKLCTELMIENRFLSASDGGLPLKIWNKMHGLVIKCENDYAFHGELKFANDQFGFNFRLPQNS